MKMENIKVVALDSEISVGLWADSGQIQIVKKGLVHKSPDAPVTFSEEEFQDIAKAVFQLRASFNGETLTAEILKNKKTVGGMNGK